MKRSVVLPAIDFMSAHATPDNDSFQLSSGELSAMREQLKYVLTLLSDTTCALEVLDETFRGIRRRGLPTIAQVAVSRESAQEHIEKNDYAYALLEEIDLAIEDRCEKEFQKLLAQLEEIQ